MAVVHEGDAVVLKVAGMGPYDNNGYVLADPVTREAYLIDAPAEAERLVAEARGFELKAVLVTHTHPDHVAGYHELKRLTGLPVAVHPDDEARLPGAADFYLEHGAELRLGAVPVRLLHTPGHTPGGICMVVDRCLISGDTLFPGGPGRTRSPDAFSQLVGSITERLLTLPEDHLVLPGHGKDTTVGACLREYAVFASRPTPPDLHGDVRWEDSQ